MLASLPFVIISCLLAVGALLALPQMIRKPGKALRSTGLVLLVAIVQVIAIALVINRPMQYFSSPVELWEMLTNQQTTKVTITDTIRGEELKKTASVSSQSQKMNPQTASALPGQEQWFPSFKPSAKGGEVTVFSGPKSGVKEQVIVWTPEGYDPQDRSKTYNVLEFIHGYPGSPVSVARALDFSGTLQKAIDQGEIAPTIVVIPEGNVNLKAPTCANVQRGAQTATWLSFDIPKMIRSVFPNVSDNRQDWMIAGNSSGAYCAARLGVLYGDVFGASGVLSGYDQPIVGNWGVRSGKTFQDNTLSSLISRPRPWTLDMYVFGAQLDRESIHIAKAFSAAQLAPGDRLQLNVKAEGGHNWATWRDQMPDLYRWWQQIRTTKAPKVSQILGADSALIPQKNPGVFSLMGLGTITAVAAIAILALALVVRFVPKIMEKAARASYLRALLGCVAAMMLVILAVLLPINRAGEFYTSIAEIIRTINGAV